MKILIVDDEATNRNVLEMMLRSYGECIMARDGREAVALFEQHLDSGKPFDLVLLDIMMPNMDGQEALKEIRSIEKKTLTASPLTMNKYSYIIMQTALDDPKHLVESYFEGRCNGYIVKPFLQDDLLAKLRTGKLI